MVELDKELSWNHHIDKTISKGQRNLNLLRRNISSCSKSTKELAYKTLVRPVLEYASSAWDPHQTTQINKLEAVQRKAARFVTAEHSRQASVTKLLEDLKWRTLLNRRFVARQTMLFKALNAQAIPPHFPRTAQRTRTSHDQQMTIPSLHLDTYKYSFFPRTIRIWNILPACLVQAPSTDSFKMQLQQHLLTGNIYVIAPRDPMKRPRLGSSSRVEGLGPVY